MEKKWNIHKIGNPELTKSLSESLNISEPIANLLTQRGISDYDSAKSFFRPSIDDLYNPFLMKDMDKAVERVFKAKDKKENILIYGDYDVDGTTSVALVYSFLKDHFLPAIGFRGDIAYYIPDRYDEGYGISTKGIDFAAENNFSLVIALDCGIKAIEKIDYAKEKNVDFIICDHHLPGDKIPNACAVLDPKRIDCNYPYDGLSGCGVGFKFMQALKKSEDIPFQVLYDYLDLVVISIASDIVPITDENRILAFYGLQVLNMNPRPGIKSIIGISGIDDKEINITDIVFKIGPRINAAGRIEKGSSAVDLMVSNDRAIAKELSTQINELNNERRGLDQDITEEALAMIETNLIDQNSKATVVYNESWHKGVIGIVASRLIEKFYRPTVVLTRSNGLVSGSARSVEGYDLYKAIDSCADLLERYGGHKHAAGLTLNPDNVESFKKRFTEYVNSSITDEQLIPQIEIDAVISIDDIDMKFYRIINQFAPYGPENMTPVFCTKGLTDNGTAKIVGSTKEHLKLDVSHPESPHKMISCIAFGLAYLYDEIAKGKKFDICYTIDLNEFRGYKNLQLIIKDLKIVE